MANLNALPDLSTLDIQAIQDSGCVLPLRPLPPPLLPPLTTIAENWDSIEPQAAVRNLEENDDSGSDDDENESDEEEQSHASTPRKIKNRQKSRVKSCGSSSGPDSLSDYSDSDLSDATSDSCESTSSSSDSDSDSQSSVSSSSSKNVAPAADVVDADDTDRASFSVREANYDKGRVTLRLSSLNLCPKKNDESKKQETVPKQTGKESLMIKGCKLTPTNNKNNDSVLSKPYKNQVNKFDCTI